MKDAPTPVSNPTATFFCTRCRRRVSFPSERRDQIVFCPFCQQALIVPNLSLSVPDSFDLESATRYLQAALPETPNDSVDASNRFARNDGGGPAIASHLLPPDERVAAARRRPTAFDPETDFDLALPGVPAPEFDGDPVSTLETPEISDADFITRMTAAPTVPDASNPIAPPTFVRPRRSNVSDAASSPSDDAAPRLRLPLGVWIGFGVVALVVAALATVPFLARRANAPTSTDAPNGEATGVFVDGEATFRTANGKLEGDEGAFVFLFPADEPFEKPLVFFDANPTRPLPARFDEFRAELEAAGGYFAQVGFDGLFSFRVARPGEYWILAVSKNVPARSAANVDARTLAELGEYLFLPNASLLERTRFDWRRQTLTPEDGRVRVDFGKIADR